MMSVKEIKKAKTDKTEVNMDKKKIIIAAAALAAVALIAVFVVFVVIPKSKYDSAIQSLTIESYDSAIEAFEELGDYKDSAFLLKKAKAGKTKSLIKTGNYDEAIELCNSLTDYDEHSELVQELSSALILDNTMRAEKILDYLNTIEGLPAKYKLPMANSNAKLLYENTATYCTKSEIRGFPVEENWYFFSITDMIGQDYEKDGQHLPDMICSVMGDKGGYAAVHISSMSVPVEVFWSDSVEFNTDNIEALQNYKASDDFIYGCYPTEVVV